MEKRAVLAFGLILVVFVVTSTPTYREMFSGPGGPGETDGTISPDPVSDSGSLSTETPEIGIPSPSAPTADVRVPGAPPLGLSNAVSETSFLAIDRTRVQDWNRDEQLITLRPDSASRAATLISVESDLYSGVFNTRGGVITSWRLKAYQGLNDPWVELVPEGRGGGPDLFIASENGVIDFSQVIFEASVSDLQINESRPVGSIQFTYTDRSGLSIVKRYTFTRDDYAVKLDVSLLGTQNAALGNKYFLRWGGGINITEPNSDLDLYEFRTFRYVGDEVDEQDIGSEELEVKPLTGITRWVGVRSKYFFIGIAPEERTGVGSLLSARPVNSPSGSNRHLSAEIDMARSSDVRDSFVLYFGPVDYNTLLSYGNHFEEVVNLGWPVISFFSYYILIAMIWLHQWISNYGTVIIVLSVIVKIILYPLTYKSMQSMQNMQKVQPKMEELRTKYKNDAKKLQQEMMKLYREQGVNPVGGCLPMLLQMPILFALYSIFNSTIELRREPFIEGWITDLSQADPYYIMPVLMGLSMLVQSKMTMKDPRQVAFVYIMPVVLIYFMSTMSSGLVLYWTMVNLLTILQQLLQNRYMPAPATT